MADEAALPDRIRKALADLPAVREVSMFGGLCFLVRDKIAVSANRDGNLLVRCDPTEAERLLDRPGAEIAQMGHRSMGTGWLQIRPAGIEADTDLTFWIETALQFNAEHPG